MTRGTGAVTAPVAAAPDPAAAVAHSAGPDRACWRWTGPALGAGRHEGTTAASAGVEIATPVGRRVYTDPHSGRTGRYDLATWTTALVTVGFQATDVVVSWTASTPPGSWLQVDLRGVTPTGADTRWYVLGRWAADDSTVHRTSVGGQADGHGDVLVDRFVANDGEALGRLQARVTLHRPAGTAVTPVLRSLTVVASRAAEPAPADADRARADAASSVVLDVPAFSQHVHDGEYPQWNGGGEAWCSPTSTAMVLAFWGASPPAADHAWVDPAYDDPWVHHAVRGVYDYAYAGAGNWPFNTAYAGGLGLDGFVTVLRSLAEVQTFIAAGLPLVLSLSFGAGQIAALPYATNGHLLVVVGFTAEGNPVVNDPASASNAQVRKVVDRGELEQAWLASSRGIVYVMRPPTVPLPLVAGATA